MGFLPLASNQLVFPLVKSVKKYLFLCVVSLISLDSFGSGSQLGAHRHAPRFGYGHFLGVQLFPALLQDGPDEPEGFGYGVLYKIERRNAWFYRAGFNWVDHDIAHRTHTYKINDTTLLHQRVGNTIDLFDLRIGAERHAEFGKLDLTIGADFIFGLRKREYWLSEESYSYPPSNEIGDWEESFPFIIPEERHLQFGVKPFVGITWKINRNMMLGVQGGPDLVLNYPISEYITVPGTTFNERNMLFLQCSFVHHLFQARPHRKRGKENV